MSVSPEVSVLIPTRNGERTIRRTLDSVLALQDCDYEIVVTDDASTDATLAITNEVLGERLSPDRLTVIRHDVALGLAGNWNSALAHARGRWSKLVFQDDLVSPTTLREMASAGDTHDVSLVVCRRRALYDGTNAHRKREYRQYLRWNSLGFLLEGSRCLTPSHVYELIGRYPTVNILGEPICHLFRTATAQSIGPFDARFHQSLDYEFAGRLAVVQGLCYLDTCEVKFRVHDSSATMRNAAERAFETFLAEPAQLICSWLTHPELTSVQQAEPATTANLSKTLGEALSRVKRHLENNPSDRDSWNAILMAQPELADAVAHIAAEAVQSDVPSVRTRRLRRWARLARSSTRRLIRRQMS